MTREEIINLGLKVKEERNRLGMTQSELAKSIGIGFSTLQALELGKSITIGNRVKGLVEKYLELPELPVISCSSNNFGGDQYASLLLKIAKIVMEPDFFHRVKGVAELLRVNIEIAAYEVIDKDLRKN